MTGGQRLAIALVCAGYLALALSIAWPIIARRAHDRRVSVELARRERVRRELANRLGDEWSRERGTAPGWRR